MEEEKKELVETDVVSDTQTDEAPEETMTPEEVYEEEIENGANEEGARFAQEVREHYDEVMQENAKAIEKEKKKKLKKGQIALIVVAAVILAIGIGVGLFLLIGKLTYKPFEAVDVDLASARPNVATTYSADEQAKIDAALLPTATEEEIKEAIALIYAKANANKIAAPNALTLARGNGTASLTVAGFKPNGGMIVRGFKVQSGDAFYYQKAAKVSDCSVQSVLSIVEGMLNQQERTYASGTGVYKTVQLKGKAAAVGKYDKPKFPYLTVGDPSSVNTCKDREEFLQKGYYLEDQRELSNFRITKDTIVLKELKEGESYISYDADQKFYTLKFSLLIEGEGHDNCVEIARQYLRDSSGSSNLEYLQYDVIFEVWNNGYAKRMYDDEVWTGSMSGSTTTSTSQYECVFYYDFDESLFYEEDIEKYKGNDWAKKIIDDYAEVFNG